MPGAPSFIPLASPDLRDEDIESLTRVLRGGMLVQGPEVAKLERKFCDFTGAAHAVAASNGTATLQLALAAMGVGPGDEVIVPSFSYIATANVVELAGAKPVFVDVQPRTFNIDPSLVSAAVSPRTKAIIPVHEFGLCCDIVEIVAIANEEGIRVVEDAACALGAMEGAVHAGTFGHFGSFSLHPRKAISCGEGGVLITNDSNLARQAKILRNHGIDAGPGGQEFVEAGYNFRMTDFQAALVSSQMQRLSNTLAKKRLLAEVYFEEIRHPDLTLPWVPEGKMHSWQTFHLLLPQCMDRPSVIEKLKDNGIGANYGAQCMPAQRFYRQKYGHDSAVEFPNGYCAWRHGLAVPLYEKLEPAQVRHIAGVLNRL